MTKREEIARELMNPDMWESEEAKKAVRRMGLEIADRLLSIYDITEKE